jgi:hypothetical protein
MYRATIALTVLAIGACDSEPAGAPVVQAPTSRPRIGVETSGTTNEQVPPEPVTVAQLVADGTYWRLSTKNGPVHVWIPDGYKKKGAATIVYVHGFYTKVDAAWKNHHLPAQFAASAINAMFIACEAPANGSEPVSWKSLAELLDTVEAGIGMKVRDKRLVALGHSGAWRTLIGWLDEPILDTVVLFDAAYGEVDRYRDWVLGAPKRRLITVGDDTKKWTELLHAQLPNTIVLDGFPPADMKIPRTLRRAQIVYIRSNVGHFPLVTGGVALPLTLRTLRGKLLLDAPLADLLDASE